MSRHRWGERVPFQFKTERECLNCGVVKVTRHECDGPRDVFWTEFYRGLDQIKCEATPPCEPPAAAMQQETAHV